MKIKKRNLYISLILLAILFLSIFYLKFFNAKDKQLTNSQKPENKEEIAWSVDKNGYLSYPLDRGQTKFSRQTINQTDKFLISKIIYESRNENIYGLLVLPTSAAELLPGIVLLPGAGVSKESELALAEKMAELDAAVLVIDQRGVGETDGNFPSLDEDYLNFLNGNEPHQHLMVYDVLKGYDLLKTAPFIDSKKIILAGESLGGRIAVIAAAIDRNIKGVLVISSAGFDFKGGNDSNKDKFLKSIDSDHYIELIAPRKIVMMHNINDDKIYASSAIKSYSKAQEPKQFVLVNDTNCNHGYCESMYEGLMDSLNFLIGTKKADSERKVNLSIAR